MRAIWVTAGHVRDQSKRWWRNLCGLGRSERLADGGTASTNRATAASLIGTTRFLPTG